MQGGYVKELGKRVSNIEGEGDSNAGTDRLMGRVCDKKK